LYLPAECIVWDFWFAPTEVGEPYRIFHLEAPRSLVDPEDRHLIARVGSAASTDLKTWERVGPAFGVGEPGAWDDRAIWTGSIMRHEGRYLFFYTALSTADRGRVQRIGLAASDDLVKWERHPANPILAADPRWYETAAVNPDGDEAWRDPFVIWNAEASEWLMLLCARANEGPEDERGVVGRARSTDLVHWEALPPTVGHGEFGQLEVPQIFQLEGRWYLIFCTGQHSAKRLARTGPSGNWYGTHYLVADQLTGPYRMLTDGPLVGDPAHDYYAGRVEINVTGQPFFMGFRRFDRDGKFVGGLSNPAAVNVFPDGTLQVDLDALWTGE
jgi:beta-fructofuranosidase